MVEFANTVLSLAGTPVRIFNHIATGTTADVYRGAINRRRVAVKIFRDNDHAAEFVDRRISEEIRLALKIKHPNITRGLLGGRDEKSGRFVLVMPFHQGISLGRHLPVIDAQPLARRAELATHFLHQMSGALEYLAIEGLTHRDIKPENIQVEPTKGRFLLMDLGLMRSADRMEKLPSSWEINGASRFRSPAKWIDFHTARPDDDLWSLGIITYRIMNGIYPFGTAADDGSEERLREMIFHALPMRRADGGDAGEIHLGDRLLAQMLRRDAPYRTSITALRRATSHSATPRTGGTSDGIKALTRKASEISDLARRKSTSLLSPVPKVALIAERLFMLGGMERRPAQSRFGARAVQWLVENNDGGSFRSMSIDSATVYCTAVATAALSRASSWEELPPDLRQKAQETALMGASTLRGTRNGHGWPWFVGGSGVHPHPTAWATVALAQCGDPSPLPIALETILDDAAKAVPSRGRLASWGWVAASAFAAAERERLGLANEHPSAKLTRFLEVAFPLVMRGEIRELEEEGFAVPKGMSRALGGVEKLPFTHTPRALLGCAYAIASGSNPYFLDAAIRLVAELLNSEDCEEVPQFALTFRAIGGTYLMGSHTGWQVSAINKE